MRILLPCLLALLASSAAGAGDNWPQFRGPGGDGLSDSRGLPVTWSETENIRWKTAIHDKGWSSPVVWGNQVWLTTADEKGHAFYAMCIDRKSGQIIHDLKLATAENPTDISKYNSLASPTPALEEGRAYIHFGTFGTFCLDTKTGKSLWENRELHVDHWRGPASSPVVWSDLLFLTFDGYDRQYVVALNKNTGKNVWQKDRDISYGTDNGDLKKAFSTPSIFEVNGRPQLVSPAAAATIAYDAKTGDEIWKVYHGGMNEAMRPLRGHGLIYLNSGHTLWLLAVREGLTGDLTQGGIAWKKSGTSSRPSPLLIGDSIYTVNDQGVLSCRDALKGDQVWQQRIPRFSPCYASPVSAEGRIYACDLEGLTAVFGASREFKLLATNKLETGCTASPAIAGDAIFVRTKSHLYCIVK